MICHEEPRNDSERKHTLSHSLSRLYFEICSYVSIISNMDISEIPMANPAPAPKTPHKKSWLRHAPTTAKSTNKTMNAKVQAKSSLISIRMMFILLIRLFTSHLISRETLWYGTEYYSRRQYGMKRHWMLRYVTIHYVMGRKILTNKIVTLRIETTRDGK